MRCNIICLGFSVSRGKSKKFNKVGGVKVM